MIRFSGFFAIKPNLTEPNRFGLNRNSVRFGLYFQKFKVLGSVGFYGSNRTVNRPNIYTVKYKSGIKMPSFLRNISKKFKTFSKKSQKLLN